MGCHGGEVDTTDDDGPEEKERDHTFSATVFILPSISKYNPILSITNGKV